MKLPHLRAMLGALAWLWAACGQAQEVVRLGRLPLSQFGAVAYIRDIAPECGIRIEEQVFAHGSEVVAALRAGQLDAGVSTLDAAIAGRAAGAPLFIVAGVARAGTRLLLRPGHKLHGLDALRGKRIGVARGTLEEMLLLALLQELAGAVQLVYLPEAQLHQALATRRIDAMMQSAPQASQAIGKGIAVAWLAPPVEAVHPLFLSEAFYHRQRALAEKFMRCFVEATRRFIDDEALAQRYVRDVVLHGRLADADVRRALAAAPFGMRISEQHLQAMTDAMGRTGALARPLPPREWLRADLLDAARKAPPPR
jgi:NitT/TauT family transport system substrate-binding protein